MRRMVQFIALLALAIAPLAHADDAQPCDDGTIAAVARWAGIKGKLVSWDEQGGLIAAAACKAMPNAPGTMIAAIAFDTNHEGPGGDSGSKVQVIALVEAGKVVAADRSVIEEDALTAVGSYRIDTAPYQLSPNVRAFGVVFTSSARGASCPDANAENELTLWIRDGDRLRAVMGTNLDGWTRVEGTACSAGTGDARSESAHMTIAVEKTSSHGLADLSITAHITQTQRKNNEYSDTGKRTARTVLKYDGKSYGIDMFRNFWYPDSAR
ncbi:hypothetical protein SAMN05216570_1846 [Dyella sp. OK004]|uniref:hypothetical protein n=1 Tax=Dyella sp. OK004 TaxID=1855292 RepID=UPI0008EE3F5D|nr:multidrug ABC transporter ATPase [Dyella sp. OK004]SFS04387.1 hypothetical protein SAMN05216570_1846 [Dyella sp. OK004]